MRHLVAAFACGITTAVAGPPYVTDDPEPTAKGQFENYLYAEGSSAAGAYPYPAAGVEINYGAYENVQLTVSLPISLNPGPGAYGEVWAPLGGGVKYRFLQQDDGGWRPQMALFPQVAIPVGAAARGAPVTELLPLWLQKDFGRWSTFGGVGHTHNPGGDNRSFLTYGWALQRQVQERLALGLELFGQSRSSVASPAATAVGLATVFDFDDRWHLVASANTGVAGPRDSDRLTVNVALKWTR